MRYVAFRFALLLTVCTSAGAYTVDFKGIKLGTPLEELKKKLPVTCAGTPRTLGDFDCVYARKQEATFGGLPTEDLRFSILGGTLDAVYVRMRGDDFEAARDSLHDKYGQTDCTFSKRIEPCLWTIGGDAVYIVLSKGLTTISYTSADGQDERNRRSAALRAGAAKDL